MGRPRVKVKIRWLEVLKVYGINPIRFTTTKRIKIADSTEVSPFRWRPDVRDSWVKIVSLTGDLRVEIREFISQKDDCSIRMIKVFIIKNMEFVGNSVLYM